MHHSQDFDKTYHRKSLTVETATIKPIQRFPTDRTQLGRLVSRLFLLDSPLSDHFAYRGIAFNIYHDCTMIMCVVD